MCAKPFPPLSSNVERPLGRNATVGFGSNSPVHDEITTGALTVADKVRSAVHRPVNVDSLVLRTRASIGVALYPEHGVETEQLLKHADKAMYLNKKAKASAPEA